jgi:hypothetical protein
MPFILNLEVQNSPIVKAAEKVNVPDQAKSKCCYGQRQYCFHNVANSFMVTVLFLTKRLAIPNY